MFLRELNIFLEPKRAIVSDAQRQRITLPSVCDTVCIRTTRTIQWYHAGCHMLLDYFFDSFQTHGYKYFRIWADLRVWVKAVGWGLDLFALSFALSGFSPFS